MRSWKVYALPVVLALALSACGSSSSSSGGGSGASSEAVKGAKKAPTLAAAKGAKGTVTYCTGKDTSGAQIQSVKDFNKKYASQGLKAKILEFPESADEQRNQFIQRQRAKSGECDIFFSDVIWTAEFAAQKWLLNMTDYIKSRKSEFIPSTLQSGTIGSENFGVPQATDSGLLYYRTDKIKKAPATWQALYAQAKGKGGVVYQGAAYEGLTVDFLELAFGAGGQVLSSDGKKAMIDSPQNLKALQLHGRRPSTGAATKAVTTYMEEPASRAFHRASPRRCATGPTPTGGNQQSKVGQKFAVAPLPAFKGAGQGGLLGGRNLVSPRTARTQRGPAAYDFSRSPQTEAQTRATSARPGAGEVRRAGRAQGAALRGAAHAGR